MRRLLLLALLLAPVAHATAPALGAADHAVVVDHTEAWRAHLVARRHTQVERLRAYAEAGVFPINLDTPGLKSMLLDEDGTPCAMAMLVIASGHRELIERLARTDNGTQFGDVTEGELYEWILTSGLTQEETAFVQVPDFHVDIELPVDMRVAMEAAEIVRLRGHFLMAAAQIEAYEADNVEIALARLGERARTEAPPTEVDSAAASWHTGRGGDRGRADRSDRVGRRGRRG